MIMLCSSHWLASKKFNSEAKSQFLDLSCEDIYLHKLTLRRKLRFFCSTGSPLAGTRWCDQHFQATVQFPITSVVDSPQQHWWFFHMIFCRNAEKKVCYLCATQPPRTWKDSPFGEIWLLWRFSGFSRPPRKSPNEESPKERSPIEGES